MARDMNVVCLTGRLTRDPEERALPSGTSVCKMGLAVNERYKPSNSNEWEERANFFDIVVFGKQAETCAQYLAKGRAVAITGKLRWSSWETDSGKRSKVEVVADAVQFLSDGSGGGGNRQEGSSRSTGSSGFRMGGDGDVPVDTSDFETAPAAAADDDDIPFLWRPTEFEDRYEHGSRRLPAVV